MSHEAQHSLSHSSLSRWATVGAVALLAGAVWVVYGRAVDAPFLCDDSISIVENESIRRLWPLWGNANVPGPLRPARDLPTSGRPLVNFTFALNYAFGELSPRGYHVVNILLHIVNALLLLAAVGRTLQLPYFAGRFDDVAGPLALVAALIWAMHPLVTETIIYTTQRTELMVALFYLATLYGSLRYWEAGRTRWLALAVLACWAGMASKEVMVSAPVMALLFDRTFNSGSLRAAWEKSRPLYVGLFSSWILLLLLNASGPRSSSAGFHLPITPTAWWLTQCEVLLMYLRLAFWPWPLSIHYEPPYLTTLGDAWIYILPAALLVLATLALLWRNSAAGWVGAFVFAILAPTLLVPIVTEIAAERRMYLPLAALVALVVAGGFAALRRVASANSALAAMVVGALVVAVVVGAVSRERLLAYADELTIWHDVVMHQPENDTALYNIGTILMERDHLDEALQSFERAIEIRPDYAQAHHNLGAVLATLGRHEEATRHFQQAVAADPHYALGHIKLGITELKAARPAKAQQHFVQALQWQPDNAEAHRGLANALLASGEPAEAVIHARAAVGGEPANAEAQNLLGAALAQLGQYQEAIEHLEAAVRLDPNLLQAQGNLMAAYASIGRRDEAIAAAEKALALAHQQGDAALVEQINAFLANYMSQPAEAPSTSDTNSSE